MLLTPAAVDFPVGVTSTTMRSDSGLDPLIIRHEVMPGALSSFPCFRYRLSVQTSGHDCHLAIFHTIARPDRSSGLRPSRAGQPLMILPLRRTSAGYRDRTVYPRTRFGSTAGASSSTFDRKGASSRLTIIEASRIFGSSAPSSGSS